jgi:hypothetical protein
MIHRIDSVNPDIDDRVIKPNQARNARNLRFAVSATDENMSGGILINGNTKLDFTPPVGENTVVGVCNDFENQVIYFALCNVNTEADFSKHGIYQIKDDVVTLIIEGSWLKFQPNMDVSIAYIDNKLYWTDGVNQPKMINIQKATGTLIENQNVVTYPNSYQEWMYTQIKRPGALPLILAFFDSFNTQQQLTTYSITANYPIQSFDNIPNTESEQIAEGYQFSYYYIYDNYEESRLAPISEAVFFSKKLEIIFPVEEFTNYVRNNNVIREVVLVYRRGNEGSWNILKRIKNQSQNYTTPFTLLTYDKTPINNYGPTLKHYVENMIFVQVLPVDGDITDSYFDAVPIKSSCNTIAINRIFHSNYVIDYDNWTDLSLNLTVSQQGTNERIPVRGGGSIERFVPKQAEPGERTFMFGRYKIGIELCDDYGRRIGVINPQEISIPRPTYKKRMLKYPVAKPADEYEQNPFRTSDSNFLYQINYKLSGTLPSWAKSYRVVMTKNLDYNYFFKTQVRVFYWYSSNNGDAVSSLPIFYTGSSYANWFPINTIQSDNKADNYNYEGLAFRLSSEEPFIWNPEEQNYICIPQEYGYTFDEVLSGGRSDIEGIELKEYKIDNWDGTYFYVKRPNADNVDSNSNPGGRRVNRKPDSTQLLSTFVSTEPPVNSYKKSEGDAWVLSRQNFNYQVYIYSKKRQSEEIYYQNENTFFVPDNYVSGNQFSVEGILRGDCYMTQYTKVFRGTDVTEAKFYFNGGVNGNYTNPGNTYTSCADKPFNGNAYKYRDVKQAGYGISMNPCNIFSPIWSSSIGQPSIVNEKQKQTIAENDIIPSGQIVLGSEINNLNRFNSIDAQSMPAENGPITATVITNTGQGQPGVMLAIGALGIQSIYLGAIQQTANDGTSAITLSKNVLGSTRPLIGQYGAQRLRNITVTPESVVYWWSEVVFDMIRYTNAGMERLGKTYMFANYLRNNFASNPALFTMYDQVNDEALLIPTNKMSVAFNEKYKTFQGQREYTNNKGETPERGASIANKHYMFLNGTVWVTKIENPKNSFFADNKTAELTIITNESPAVVKQWNNIKVFGPRPSDTQLKSEDDSNQASYVLPSWYIQRKSDYEAAIRRDVNSGNVMSGKVMESRILYSTFVFSITGFDKLNFVEIRSNKSVVQ